MRFRSRFCPPRGLLACWSCSPHSHDAVGLQGANPSIARYWHLGQVGPHHSTISASHILWEKISDTKLRRTSVSIDVCQSRRKIGQFSGEILAGLGAPCRECSPCSRRASRRTGRRPVPGRIAGCVIRSCSCGSGAIGSCRRSSREYERGGSGGRGLRL